MLMLLTLCVPMTSCSDDEDDGPDHPDLEQNNLIGVWVSEDSDDTYYLSYTFKSDGTGSCFTKSTIGSMTLTDSWEFVYAYDDENKSLQLYPKGDDTVYRYTVNLTGKTLMLTNNNGVLVLIKQ